MKKILTLMSFCIMFAMQSCTSDEEPMMQETTESETSISHMVVKFEDRIYETDAMTVGDSVRYLNEEYAEVYQSKIKNNPNIAAVVSSDSIGTTYVDYYPTEKKLLEKYDFIQLEENKNTSGNTTRSKVIDLVVGDNSSPILAVAEFYDDKNFKDTELITYLTPQWYGAVPNLKDHGFNDKASSIKVYNKIKPSNYYTIYSANFPYKKSYLGDWIRPVLKCYHNSYYQGGVIYCIASPPDGSVDHTDTNLKTIGWNDRISSIEWLLVVNLSLLEGDNPKYPAHKPC